MNIVCIGGLDGFDKGAVKAAIREIVEAVVDKCAEEGCITDESIYSQQEGSTCQIDRNSILQVKKLIQYE